MTAEEDKANLESAADEFAAKLKESFDVKEVIYIVAFEEGDALKLAHGTTETAPEAARQYMLTETLNKRKN